MSQNTLPSGLADLTQLAHRMSAGMNAHARWLHFAPGAAEKFAETLALFLNTEAGFAATRSRKALAATRLDAADAAQTSWLARARLVVMQTKGASWSEAWIETGFTHRATNVPKSVGARTELCRRLVAYLAAYPQCEFPYSGVTESAGAEVYAEMIAAERAARAALADRILKKRARDAAERALRGQMRRVRLMLGAMFTMEDARWRNFGLNQPTSTRSARKARVCPATPSAEIIPLPAHAAESFDQSTLPAVA